MPAVDDARRGRERADDAVAPGGDALLTNLEVSEELLVELWCVRCKLQMARTKVPPMAMARARGGGRHLDPFVPVHAPDAHGHATEGK